MRTQLKLLTLLTMTSLLSGCVAALLPLAAASALGKSQIDRTKAKRKFIAAGAVNFTAPPIVTVEQADAASMLDIAEKSSGQRFSGKGEGVEIAAANLDEDDTEYLSRLFKPLGPAVSPYAGFAAYALGQAQRLEAGEGVQSVILVPKVDIFKPKTIGCGGKPLAVLIDLDDQSDSDWITAQTLYRQNGLAEIVRSLRDAQVSIIWLSEKPVATAETISSILKEGGLSEGEADDFLFLDRGGNDRKQARRWDAARNYCIVAMAGDERADFDELYDYLRDPDGAITLEHMFGNGWFLTPPPLVIAPDTNDDDISEDEG